MSATDNLSYLESKILIEWFMYFLPMEQRGRLMSELPAIYNKVCKAPIVQVVRLSDGSAVL